MSGLRDFLFGSGSLKKAAGDSDDKTPPPSKGDAGLDIASMAQKQADQAKAPPAVPKASGKSPLSTTMTPIEKKAGK